MSGGGEGSSQLGEALEIKQGTVQSLQSVGGLGWVPPPLPRENRVAPSANYLPFRGFFPLIWGFGVERKIARASNWCLPSKSQIQSGNYTKEMRA